jgi:hypothetical protein
LGFCSATTLSGSTALPFVISTEAKRSGEISVWMLFLGNVFLAEPGFPTSRYEQGPRVWLSLKLTTGLADPRGDETGFVLAIHTPPHTDS